MPDYVLNPTLEIAAAEGGRYRVRLPLHGRGTDATAYQVNLLKSFAEGSTLETVLAAFPFDKESTRDFLTRCVDQAVLLLRDDAGDLRYPSRNIPASTFFQAPGFDPMRPAAFTFLGVPFDGGTTGMPGARFGPAALRQAGSGARYRLDPVRLQPEGFFDLGTGRRLLQGIALADAGDVACIAGEDIDVLQARITEVVKELLDAGSIPIVLGGDHSISYGVLRAFKGRKLGIVHVDAHSDLGSYPGDPLHHGTVFVHVLRDLPQVTKLYQVGLRGVVEGAAAGGSGPSVFQMGIDTLRTLGVDAFVARLPEGGEYYVSVDIDAVDPSFAPSTGTPVAGGLFPHELKALLRAVASRRAVVGMDLVEVGQPQGPGDATAQVALEAVLSFADGAVQYVQNALADAPASRTEEESP